MRRAEMFRWQYIAVCKDYVCKRQEPYLQKTFEIVLDESESINFKDSFLFCFDTAKYGIMTCSRLIYNNYLYMIVIGINFDLIK